MKGAQAGARGEKFVAPPTVVFVDIDKQTGLLATPGCPQVISESFVAGTEPREYCSWHSGYRDVAPAYPQVQPSP